MKKLVSFLLAFILLAFNIFPACLCDTSDSTIKLTVNGRKTDTLEKYGVAVSVEEGIIRLPLRAIADAYGMSYEYDENEGTITCATEETQVIFTIDGGTITRDGIEESIKHSVVIENSEAVITGDALVTAFDLMVNYNTDKNLATVIKTDPKREADLAEKQQLAQDKGKSKGSKADEIITVVSAMNKGFVSTLKLFAITLLGALPLGLLIALCSMSKFKPLKYFTRLLVWIIRGTPLMLQLLIIFYIPGMLLTEGSFWPRGEEGRFMAASVAFIINYAFYFSEIYRGGIENVPKGQVEAGQVLGMTKTQIFFNVTLLQMIKRIVPPMSNEIITLVKDTSIARIISMQEVIWAGYAFLKSSHGYSGLLWPLFFTGVYYLLFNGILTILFGKLEKKLSYFN